MNKSEHPTCPAGFKTSIGGQAIIEGVMMKGPKKTAMSIRKTDGTLYQEVWENPARKWYNRTPFVRGVVNFVTSLVDGYKCLMKSAEISTEGIEDENPSKFDKWLEEKFGDKLVKAVGYLSMVLGMVLAMGLFVYLPALILFLPIRQSVFKTMMVAFLTGVVVDFFSVSPIGLTSLALVPVAFSRQYVVWLVFGNEVYSRAENLSVERQGWRKVVFSILLVTLLFLLIYIAVDSAGTRPFWIDVVKGAVSLAVAVPLSFYIVSTLSSEGGSRWR